MSKIYLAGPISGCTFQEANQWRVFAAMLLKPLESINPLRGVTVEQDTYFNPDGGDERAAEMKMVFARDHHDAMTCDAMLVNFIGAKRVSVGTVMEIAWAHAYRKPVVMAIEGPTNPNWDIFLVESVPFIESTFDAAITTMRLMMNVEHDGYKHKAERSERRA